MWLPHEIVVVVFNFVKNTKEVTCTETMCVIFTVLSGVYYFHCLFSHVSDILNAFLQLFLPHTYCSFPIVDRDVTVYVQTLVSAFNATVMFALIYNCAISNNTSV
jgi:hypothetical protein